MRSHIAPQVRILTALGVSVLTASFVMSAPASALMLATPVYGVMNTSEYLPDGVHFRTAPDWNRTERITGLGIYAGEQVRLLCWESGTNVPRRDGQTNVIWYRAENVTRTDISGLSNSGWLNAHFVNDGMGPGQTAPDVAQCSAPTPAQPPAPPANIGSATKPCFFNMKWRQSTLTWSYPGKHRYLGNAYQAIANWNNANVGLAIIKAASGERGNLEFVDDYGTTNDLGEAKVPKAWQADPANPGHAQTSAPTEPYSPNHIKIVLYQAGLDQKGLGDKTRKDRWRTYTATHEVGHALGLAHLQDCGVSGVASLMYRGNKAMLKNGPKFTTPQENDKLSLRLLY